MKRYLKSIALSILMGSVCSVFGQTKFESLNFLMSIKGNQIVSGQHNDQKNRDCGASGATGPRYWTDQVYSITGKYPGLWGGDMLFHGSDQLRWEMTYEAERQWNSGAIVNIMWHACPPTQGASCGWDGGILSSLTAQQFQQLLTNGSALNNTWKARVNEIAVHLQYLKEKGVEVFWRPYHEQNQTAFWWNSQGPENTKALWRMMHNYMTNDLGLDNLIWVWDVQDLSTGFANWNPGNQYWDVLALDIYADGYTNNRYYNDMVNVATAANKLIAIGECFNLPTAQHINQYPLYTFFMNWAYGLKKWYAPDCRETNTDAFIREVYNNPKVITLDEMPGWGKNRVPANIAANKPVTASSTETGNNIATNVNDRNYGTRWSSNYTSSEWIAINLQNTYTLDSIRITWETARATAYDIQVSANGTTWTTIRSVTNNTTNTNFFTLQKQEANHVRILGINRATVYGYSIHEIEVYGRAKSTPYSNTPIAIPGTIQAEDYDLGGENVGYYDTNPTNSFGVYRTDGVDIENCTDAGGGYNLGNVQAGEWTNYSINVTQAGTYDIRARVASTSAGKTFYIELDGQNITGNITVPNTGGWQTWQTVTVPNKVLTAGNKTLRVVMNTDLFNLNYIQIVPSTITAASTTNINNELVVFPNPAVEEVHFQLNSPISNDATLEMTSILGNTLFVQAVEAQTGAVNVSNIPAGSYIIKITTNSNVLTQHIQVLE